MLEKAKAIRVLIYKRMSGDLSIDEQKELDDFINASPENAELVDLLTSDSGMVALLQQYEADDQIWAGEELQLVPVVTLTATSKKRPLYWIAAAILLLLAGGAIFYTVIPVNKTTPPVVADGKTDNDVLPGSRRAVLRLANQSTIDLDSAATGVIAHEGSTAIEKAADGSVRYNPSGEATPVGWQTLETPNGGYYVLQLADGSRCWVNAASKLRFPAAFAGAERRVQLSGEAYFEIAPSKKQPFLVETDNGTVIRVTGTKFNVNAYSDEPVEQTSLLEGSVTINTYSFQQSLTPGRQATFTKADMTLRVAPAAVDASVRWTRGLFNFNRAGVQAVCRELARWYDIEVELAPGLGDGLSMQGGFSRNLPLREVLDILQKYDNSIVYTLTGRKLLVQKRSR